MTEQQKTLTLQVPPITEEDDERMVLLSEGRSTKLSAWLASAVILMATELEFNLGELAFLSQALVEFTNQKPVKLSMDDFLKYTSINFQALKDLIQINSQHPET